MRSYFPHPPPQLLKPVLAHHQESRLARRRLAQHQEPLVVRRHGVAGDRPRRREGTQREERLLAPTEKVGDVLTVADTNSFLLLR